MNVAAGRQRVQFSASAMDCLLRYSWRAMCASWAIWVERLSIPLRRPHGHRGGSAASRYRPRDWTAAPEADLVPAILPVVVDNGPPCCAHAGCSGAVVRAAEMTEREALFLLEDAPAGSGTILPPEGIDLRAHVSAIEESLIRQALSAPVASWAQLRACWDCGARRWWRSCASSTSVLWMIRRKTRRTKVRFCDGLHLAGKGSPARILLLSGACRQRTNSDTPARAGGSRCRDARPLWSCGPCGRH